MVDRSAVDDNPKLGIPERSPLAGQTILEIVVEIVLLLLVGRHRAVSKVRRKIRPYAQEVK